jgi:hypothetical protein
MKNYYNFLKRLMNKKLEHDKKIIVFEKQCPHCAARGAYSFKFSNDQKQTIEKPNENKN